MRRFIAGVSACIAFSTSQPAHAHAQPRIGTCTVSLAQALEASGGERWEQYSQLHLEGQLEQSGVRTPFSSLTDLRTGRWRDVRTRGPFVLAEGDDGDVAWMEWQPGDIIEQTDPGRRRHAQTERYERMRAYWLTQRMQGERTCVGDRVENGSTYSVYRLTPDEGAPFELWLDTATRMVSRRVSRNGIYQRTTQYGDFREVAGLKLPHRVDSTDYTGSSQRLIVSNIELAARVDDSAFVRPKSDLTDYSFPAGRDRVRVPVRLLNNHLYIPVKFNGSGPHWMMLDTGAVCLVSPSFAAALRLQSQGADAVRGAGSQAVQLHHSRLDSIEIGGIVLRNQRCDVVELKAFGEFEGIEQFGVVGYEVYRRFVVRQNHAAGHITFIEPSSFEPASTAQQVSFDFNGIGPLVAGSIDGFSGRFFIDTGSRNTASPHEWFIERHDLRERYGRGIDAVSGFGLGGAVKSQITRAGEIRLGDVAFQAPLLDMSYGASGALSTEDAAVLVGTGLLRRYGIVTFDYSRRRILFEQPQRELENDLDRSGLQMKIAPRGFEVLDVVPRSPAAEAGLRVGDVVVSIAARRAERWTLAELRDYLRLSPTGKRVAFVALRADERLAFELVLRDLLPFPPGSRADLGSGLSDSVL